MAELSREHIIEVRIGSGEPPSMRIRPGEPMGPMLIGSDGAWPLQGPGVAPEHAELYFDGSQLFVRSVNPGTPAVVGGRPVPGVWTPLEPPCEISLGGGQLWFGPSAPRAAAPGRMSATQLLEDDDNVATKVADQQKDGAWGNVGEMVQRGMASSRAPAAGARPPPPEPPPPPPMPSFWPTGSQPGGAPPPPPPEPDYAPGPSRSTRKDDSGMTKIEPVEEVERRREMSLSSGRRFPQVGDLSTSGSSYPRVGVASTAPPLTVSGSNYPRAAPMQAPAAAPYGGTEVLQSSPMPPSAHPPPSSPSSAPGSVPSFGVPPPPSSVPSHGPPPPGVIPPPPLDYSRFTGSHPRVNVSLPPPSVQQPTTTEGVVSSEPAAGISGPKKALIALFPLLIAAVAVLFFGEELGLDPKPPRRPAATAKASASAAARPAPTAAESPTSSAAATSAAPPEPNASAAPPATSASAAPPEPNAKETPPDPARSPRAAPSQQVKGASERSLQRQAADAVAAGSFARAAALYDQLAKEHPNKPAYAEAAAIMREKAGLN